MENASSLSFMMTNDFARNSGEASMRRTASQFDSNFWSNYSLAMKY